MLYNPKVFNSKFGFSVPTELKELYTNKSFCGSMPLRFIFDHVSFIVEIQYLIEMSDPSSYDLKNNLFTFAVDSEGYELSVELNSGFLEVFQDEYGEIESTGLKIQDFLKADTTKL